jgi:glycogen synthase
VVPTILTTTFGDVDETEEVSDELPVIRVRAWPPNRDYYFAPRMISSIRQGRWEVVHLQGIHTFVAPLTLAAAYFLGIPYVVTLHTGGHSSRLRRIMQRFAWILQTPLLRRAERVIAVSEFERSFFSHLWRIDPDKFSVIQSGVDIAPGDDLRTHSTNGSVGGEAEERKLIISLGRLERYKNHQRVIRALPLVLQEVPDVHLCILGGGNVHQKRSLTQLVEFLGLAENVSIESVPLTRRREYASLVASASVVVSLSEYESQGIGIMEAIRLRRPVLVSDTSALSELVARGVARGVSPKADLEEIAQALIEAVNDPMPPPPTSLPTWDEAAAALVEVYEDVSRARAPREGIRGS